LVPPSAIQGKVIDRDGNPVAGTAIAFGFVNVYGVPPVMEPVAVQTDVRGEFCVALMQAGRYYVQAIPVRPGASLPAYYLSAGVFGEAQPVLVRSGTGGFRNQDYSASAAGLCAEGQTHGSGPGGPGIVSASQKR
jgi:hypothetical protein